jgi:hypothetical protein
LKHGGAWNKCPLLERRNTAYKPPDAYTATILISMGHRNWSGLEKMIVDAKESSSNKFWNAASTVENEPRCEASTSYSLSLVKPTVLLGAQLDLPLGLYFAHRDHIPRDPID